jgi:hypothetical protein
MTLLAAIRPTRLAALTMISLLIVPAGGALAEEPAMLSSISGEKLSALMQGWGYRAALSEDDYGDPTINSAASGLEFDIYFYECSEEKPKTCTSIMMSVAFDEDEPMEASLVNSWNADNRFSRASIDDEGDPILEQDLSLEGGISSEALKLTLRGWEQSLADFAQHIGWK